MGNYTIRHVIFDFDGTIADSMKLAVELYNQVADKHKFNKIREEEYEYLRSLSILEKCKFLNVSLLQIPRVGNDLYRSYNRAISSIEVFNGIKEVILDLKEKGFKLSIVSSNSSNNIRKFLANNNLDVFDSIYTAKNIFGKGKAINSFIKKHNLRNEELVYIGDEHRDIVASKENKIKVIAVTWGYDSLAMLTQAKPDFIIEKPSEIAAIIIGQNNLKLVCD